MAKKHLLMVLSVLLSSCQAQESRRIPLYHLSGINYRSDRYHHLLLHLNSDTLRSLKEKKASFFFAVYSRSCSESCSVFDYSLYQLASRNDAVVPYIEKESYDLLNPDFPLAKENAILFYEKGTLLKQVDIDESNVFMDKVGDIILENTYDEMTYIANDFSLDESASLDSYTIRMPDSSFSKQIEAPSLFLRHWDIEDYSKIQSRKGIRNILFYRSADDFPEEFYQKNSIKKEELETSSSYYVPNHSSSSQALMSSGS